MKKLLAIVPLVCLLSVALPGQYVTVAYESFDYTTGGLGGLGGGAGWENTWWSGGAMGDAVITSPGMDATGNQATTAVADAGSYRKPDASGWGNLVFNGRFGTDGSTMWIKFRCRRTAGGDDQYGGLSLNEQFVGEKLYLGSPWQAFAWGMADVAGGGASVTVPGSSVDAATWLVYRIDYMSGQERLRCWIDPTEEYPYANPAIDTMIGDHLWNELRLQSGGAATQTGYDFDDIRIEIKAGELVVDADTVSAAAGGTITMTTSVDPMYAGMTFAVAGSLSGTSPGIPFGGVTVPLVWDAYFDLCLMNFNIPPFSNTYGMLDANGQATSQIILPPGLANVFVGQTANHAAAVLDASLTLVHATNAAPTVVTP